MNKTYKKSLDLYFNEWKDLSNKVKHDLKFLIEKDNKYFITNGYGFIRFTNNQIIEDLKQLYKINIKDNVSENIKKAHDTQWDNNYCNRVCSFADITNDDIIVDDILNKKYIKVNDRKFDYAKIKHIQNLLGKDIVIYSSDKDDNFINVVGKNGYAFLLGCIVY